MRIFAIGDLHLSLSADKPMDIFGEVWRDHMQTLRVNWLSAVNSGDWVLIPGDISWAMQLEAASPDLCFLGGLPGNKLLLRGNHDYWWSSRTKVEAVLPDGMRLLQNDSITLGDIAVCGTRGWACPGSTGFTADDQKIYARELQRLELSLMAAEAGKDKLVMMHFPPFSEHLRENGFTALFSAYGVKTVVYAHLHGAAHKSAFEGVRDGVNYIFAAGDYLRFCPRQVF